MGGGESENKKPVACGVRLFVECRRERECVRERGGGGARNPDVTWGPREIQRLPGFLQLASSAAMPRTPVISRSSSAR